ncbi:MAG: hypothetical protein K2Y37_15825, partial [Pirellulales bacterium]|nr:hypothetical protein [Pirellulales bacterium]
SRNRSLREEPFFMEYQLPTISQKVQIVKHAVPFPPIAPGTKWRSRRGIRVNSRSRQFGTTDMPVESSTTWPAVSTDTSIPALAPSCDGESEPTTGRPSVESHFMTRYTFGASIGGGADPM